MATLILLNKPFNVLSQFSDSDGRCTLKQYISQPDVYPAGRLDYDSEGLLLLTDDGALQAQIANPKHKMVKTYWVQVEGRPTEEDLQRLRDGVELKDGPTRPAKVSIINEPDVWARIPPIRQRANDLTTWLEIRISEGRNRQVGRMTANIGYPTLRLIRSRIGNWGIDDLAPGEHKVVDIHMPNTPRQNRPAQRHARGSNANHRPSRLHTRNKRQRKGD